MHSMSIFKSTKQDEICTYLEKTSKKDVDEQEAKEALKDSKLLSSFIIGNEIKSSLSESVEQNRYFQIYFEDVRMDESRFQITPSVVFMKGFIKISKEGELSVSDDCYSTNVNAKFFFENNELKMAQNVELLEKQSNKCVIL